MSKPPAPKRRAPQPKAQHPRVLTPHARIRKVEAVVNAASGHVGPHAAEQLEALTKGYGLKVRIANPSPSEIGAAVRAAVESGPDLVLILAGDGTARYAAELSGPDGPPIAPLPGGTMNMLPHAVYGMRTWQDAVTATLTEGMARPISGGRLGDHKFYVAAMLGAPALFADAREAVRMRQFRLAVQKMQRAWSRAFQSRLRIELDGHPLHKTEALTLICPLVSRVLDEDARGLEAVELDPHSAAEALRLGARTLLSNLLGDWRSDPAVTTALTKRGTVRARGRIPVLLDGEPHRLESPIEIRFVPKAVTIMAPPLPNAPTQAPPAK